jgi:hypothetical protein
LSTLDYIYSIEEVKNMDFFDKGEITDRSINEDGFLEVSAKIARSGIQEYFAGEFVRDDLPSELREDPSTVIRILRPDKEVFSDDAMKSFAFRPVTDNHPSDFVNSKNVTNLQVGFSKGEVKRNDNKVEVDLVIQDQRMIEKVNEGKNQLSAGYRADIRWKSGLDNNHGVYDAQMVGIRANHIALVDNARGGPELRLSDSWEGTGSMDFKTWTDNKITLYGHNEWSEKKEARTMATRVVDGITVEFSEQGAEVVDKLLTQAEAMQAKVDASEIAVKDAKKKVDELQGKLDAEKAKALKSEDLDQMVADRAELIDKAKGLVEDVETKGLSDIEIKKAVVSKLADGIDVTDKSADYVNAMFDAFVLQTPQKKNGLKSAVRALQDDGENEGDIVEAARKRFRDRSAYKPSQTA